GHTKEFRRGAHPSVNRGGKGEVVVKRARLVRVVPRPIELTDWDVIEGKAEAKPKDRPHEANGEANGKTLFGRRAWGRGKEMSDREAVIDLIRQLAEDATLADIIAALKQRFPQEQPPPASGVRDDDWPTRDLTDEEWMAAIAEDWAEDLGDPRQDAHAQ